MVESDIRTEPDDIELLEMWEALPVAEKLHDNEQIDLDEFLEADDRLFSLLCVHLLRFYFLLLSFLIFSVNKTLKIHF